MSEVPRLGEKTLLAAAKVAEILAQGGVESALIGAVALAAHGYPRSTEELDFATCIDPLRLHDLANLLRGEGFTVELSEPDAQDPLGGVLRLSSEGIDRIRIEIVNFMNPPAGGFPALLEVALRDALPFREGTPLRVVTLPHLRPHEGHQPHHRRRRRRSGRLEGP